MTNKSIRQLFVERLAKVGLALVDIGTDETEKATSLEPIRPEQLAELDAALNDLEQTARTDELSKLPMVKQMQLGDDDRDSLDQFVDQFGGDADPVYVSRSIIAATIEGAIEFGKRQHKASGLNDAEGLASLFLADANAVEIKIAGQLVAVDVDGVQRFGVAGVDRLIIVDANSQSRYVVLRDGQSLETIPDTPGSALDDGTHRDVPGEQ